MIDPSLRTERLVRELAADDCAVVLLDVVLGHGAHPDPAVELAEVIAASSTPVVVSLVGTRDDPQDLEAQAETLAAAGAVVHASNAAATREACPCSRRRLRHERPDHPTAERADRRHGRRLVARRRADRARCHDRAGRLVSPRGRDRGGADHGDARPSSCGGQRRGRTPDDLREGGPRRRTTGVRGARPAARSLPARRSADRLGPGIRTAAWRAHRRRPVRGSGGVGRGGRGPARRRCGAPGSRVTTGARSDRWRAWSHRRCGCSSCTTTSTTTRPGARSTRGSARCCATAPTRPT